MFKALSNPHRLKIFARLTNCCDGPGCGEGDGDAMKKCVGELGKDMGITASTVSHHLKELHNAGLISMERRGQNIDCWVDAEVTKYLGSFFLELGPDKSKGNI